MASSVAASGKAGRPIEINEDDNSVDEEQLEEYSEEVEDLGSFPVSIFSSAPLSSWTYIRRQDR